MAGFGPSQFEQDIDGGVQNATTALFGNPMAAGRMAYMRARAGLDDQQLFDAQQVAASKKAMADILAAPGAMGDAARHNLLANSVLANQTDGAAPIFKSAYGNLQGYTDADRAGGYVGGGGVITPSDAFSQAGQANIIQGQNQQADALEHQKAADAFTQFAYGQGQENSRNAATNAQSGSNNAATIAGDMARNNSSPEKQAEDRILKGTATQADRDLVAQLHPGSAGSAFTLTPQDTGQVYGEIEAQLGIPAVVKSTGRPPDGAPTIDPSLEAQVAARASDIFNAQPRDQKNLASAVAQAIKGTVTKTPGQNTHWFSPPTNDGTPTFSPAGTPAAAAAQPAAPAPVPAGYVAIGTAPDGRTVYRGPDGKQYAQ